MIVSRLVRLGLVAIATVSLSGCGFLFETRGERAMRNTPNFKSGYADGCATANAQGVNYGRDTTRDTQLYQTDKAYRAGWAAGVSSCRANLAAGQPGTPPQGPIPDTNPGQQH
jgi:hypothetical protein